MSYEPRHGGVPAKAIAALRDEGPMTLDVLADRIEQDANTVRSCLAVAIDHGTVAKTRSQHTGQWIYQIGDGIPLRRHEPGESLPVQRTVPVADSPGVDIDAIHRSTIWQTAPMTTEPLFTLRPDGCLSISTPDRSTLTLDLEQTQQLRQLLAGVEA